MQVDYASFERLMQGIVNGEGEGWAGIENAGQRAREASKQMSDEEAALQRRQCETMLRCFSTPDGEAALRLLINTTFASRPSERQQAARTAEEYTLAGKFRDGQASIVFMILDMMRLARGEPQPDIAQGGDQ